VGSVLKPGLVNDSSANTAYEGYEGDLLLCNEWQTPVAMPDVQNFFHKVLAVIFAKVQYLYFRRKLSASSIE